MRDHARGLLGVQLHFHPCNPGGIQEHYSLITKSVFAQFSWTTFLTRITNLQNTLLEYGTVGTFQCSYYRKKSVPEILESVLLL